MKLLASFVLAMATLWAGEAGAVDLTSATKAVTYFNMPGADRDRHDRELKACLVVAEEGIYGPATNVLGVGIVPEMLGNAAQNYVRRANVENCMVVRGWRVVEADAGFAKLTGEELSRRLTAQVGAEDVGPVLRRWSNDGFEPGTRRGAMPGYVTFPSLSLKALAFDASLVESLKTVEHMEIVPWNRGWPVPIPVEKLDARPADSAVIVLTLRATKKSDDVRLFLLRSGPDRLTPPSEGALRMGAVFSKKARKTSDGRLEETIFAVVPAGRWRLSGAGVLVNFCMGAPFMDLAAGDVVFAGTFDFEAPGFGWSLETADARAFLGDGAPVTASALRSAEWVNGEQTACMGSAMYALERPGAPFLDGYIPAGRSRVP